MKMSVDEQSMLNNEPTIIVEHGGLTCSWNVGAFDKKVIGSQTVDLCKHINQYWSTLNQVEQAELFTIYTNIRNCLETTFDTVELTHNLTALVGQLYSIMNIDKVKYWIEMSSDIIISDTFAASYVEDDLKPGNRAKTYIRSDYIDLVSLALCLRLMVPIWGEFIYRIKGEVGTNFKEFHSFQLLNSSSIISSAPMAKLNLYVESIMPSDNSMNNTILSGIGSQDYGRWLVALVSVRRLCLGDITGSNRLTNLVTYIFNYIKQRLASGNNASFGAMVKPKAFESANAAAGDHNASRTEGYKLKQPVPIGDIAIIEHYAANPYVVANNLDSSIPKELLDVCLLKCRQALVSQPLSPAQITLTTWVLGKVISPRGMVHLNKDKVINCISVVQAWLWHRNHKQLSCLVGAIPYRDNDELKISGVESRTRIPREHVEVLNRLYPYNVVKSKKQKAKPTNEGVAAIDALALMFGSEEWILKSDSSHIKDVTGDEFKTRYSTPHDIKGLLSTLVIDLKAEVINKLNGIQTV